MKTFCIGLGLFLAACGAGDWDLSKAPVTVSLGSVSATKVVPSGISKVVLEVSGSDFSTITKSATSPFANTLSFSTDVPVGSSRTFSVKAKVSSDTTIGYLGSTTTTISSGSNNVPVAIGFVNFANDDSGDALASNRPDITSISLPIDTKGTTTTDDDTVSIVINFASAINTQEFVIFVEFDTDSNATTGSTRTIIDRNRSTLAANFSAGSEFYLLLEHDQSGSTISTVLYDSKDQSVSFPHDANATTALVTSTQVKFSIKYSAFVSTIDSDVIGRLNILTGVNSDLNFFLSPTDLSTFLPGDIAVDDDTVGTIRYDRTFDTSSL